MKDLIACALSDLVERHAEVLLRMTPDELGKMLGVRAVTQAHLATLSGREREVYDLVVLYGSTNAQISTTLLISVKTVQTHRAKINRKLGARSTADLVRLAAAQGVL
jgi:FixJ family two-component response regulator